MATTLGRLDPLVKWPHEVTWLIKSDISPSLRGLWLPKLTRWMFILKGKGPPSIESFDALITLPSYHMTDAKRYISTSAGPMATKLDRVVGSNTALLSIKSHNLLIMWSYKVTWQMKNVHFLVTCRYRDFLKAYRSSWTLDARVGRWTLDTGLWTLDSGRWALDSGH